jgi:hypothetical protein
MARPAEVPPAAAARRARQAPAPRCRPARPRRRGLRAVARPRHRRRPGLRRALAGHRPVEAVELTGSIRRPARTRLSTTTSRAALETLRCREGVLAQLLGGATAPRRPIGRLFTGWSSRPPPDAAKGRDQILHRACRWTPRHPRAACACSRCGPR